MALCQAWTWEDRAGSGESLPRACGTSGGRGQGRGCAGARARTLGRSVDFLLPREKAGLSTRCLELAGSGKTPVHLSARGGQSGVPPGASGADEDQDEVGVELSGLPAPPADFH